MTGTPLTQLRSEFMRLYPEDVAAILESQPLDDSAALLASEPPERASDVLEHLSPDVASRIIDSLEDSAFAAIVPSLDPSRAAAFLSRLPEGVWEERLNLVDPRTAAELTSLMSYTPDTAGGIMDPRVATFHSGTTADQALRRLRAMREEEFDALYIIDTEGTFLGSIELESLAVAEPDQTLDELDLHAPVAVQATSSMEEVVEILDHGHDGGLPVVDYANRLLGVIRPEELRTATEEEASADLLTMVGVSKEERALSTPLFSVRKRLPWLNINLITAFLAATVVGIFESTIARISALAVLLPIVAGQSGNSGAQALAVTFRGLTLREVRLSHWRRMLVKEITVGLIDGIAVATITGAVVLAWSRSFKIAIVISVSMVISMVIAGVAGTSIPMILKALGQDPAQSSSILLTTVTDVVGFFSFLGLATLLL